jgi:hypothetical protein
VQLVQQEQLVQQAQLVQLELIQQQLDRLDQRVL